MIGGGTQVPTSQRVLRQRTHITGSRVMIWLGRIRCRSPSKHSNLVIALPLSKRAMEGEAEEGQDGCRTPSMGLKICRYSICTVSLLSFALLGDNVG